jgi:hypothetical protein
MDDMTKKQDIDNLLKEYKLSWAGKLFFAGVAAKLAGMALKKQAAKMRGMNEQDESGESDASDAAAMFPFKIKGTPEQLEAIMQVIKSSKEFQEEINREGATVESVMQKLNIQNLAKKAFEEKTGKPWPL